MPVTHIEPIADAQRVVAARRWPIHRGVRFAAGFPLSGDPPAADFERLGRIDEVEDHHDVADVTLGGRRDVGVAAVEIKAMHATARRAPFGDQLGRCRIGHIVYIDTAADLVAVRLCRIFPD